MMLARADWERGAEASRKHWCHSWNQGHVARSEISKFREGDEGVNDITV
jgi:hypothetical protein